MISSSVLLCLTPLLFGGFLALKVTSPSEGASWNLQGTNTVTWTSVATDPNTFDIVLANNNPNCAPTGMSQVIKQKVSRSDGKVDIGGIAPVKACDGYQINLVATGAGETHSNGILAQSAPFTATQASATAAAAQTSGAPPAPTSQSPGAVAGANSTSGNSTASQPSIVSAATSPKSNSSATAASAGSLASTTTISFQRIIAAVVLPAIVLYSK